jgi:anti-sigma B factor antagonist
MAEFEDFCAELLRPADDVAVVQASGELDIHSSHEFRGCLGRAVDEGVARVVVDLTGVTFIDSSALGALVAGARRAVEVGTELAIVCPPGSVARVLEITGLDRVFAVYATREEALGAAADGKAR